MSNETIIYDGLELMYKQANIPPLTSRSYLIKNLLIYVDGFENAVSRGLIPLKKIPVILGSNSVSRVLETGSLIKEKLSGTLIIVNPITSSGVLGYDIDGVLSRYSTIPYDAIFTEIDKPETYYALLYNVSIGTTVGYMAQGRNLLIIGGGVSGISAALSSKNNALKTTVFTEDINSYRILKKNEISVFTRTNEVKGVYDIIYYATLTPKYFKIFSNTIGKNSTIIVNPYYVYSILIDFHATKLDKTTILKAMPSKDLINEAVKLSKYIVKYVRKIVVDNLKNMISILPVKGLGIIIVLK